ncbi:MAG: SDR family oxidoreductase [Solirubrobacterales bacterium]
MDEKGALSGRTALVTGVGGAIGRAIARNLKDSGAYVIGMDRSPLASDSFLDEVVEADLGGGPVPSIPCPARELDFVIHGAGGVFREEVGGPEFISDRSVIDKTINDNFVSFMDLVAICRPAMTSDSSITVLSSINAIVPFGLPIYSATKGAVNSFVIAMAPQLLNQGIRLNAVAMGTVDHPGLRDLQAADVDLYERLRSTVPGGKFLTLDEAASGVVAVAVKSRGVAGSVSVIDKGQSNFVALGRGNYLATLTSPPTAAKLLRFWITAAWAKLRSR